MPVLEPVEYFSLIGNRIQGSWNTSSAVGLSSGSYWNIQFRKSLASRDRKSGAYHSQLQILSYSSASVAPLYGKNPQRSANKRTPVAQISAGGPEYSCFVTISGAM
jgi:hypothetical protein